MINDQILKNKYIDVDMNQYEISTEEKPLIGTKGLGPCISFVLHCQERKKAIVGHISVDVLEYDLNLEAINKKIDKLIKNNNLENKNFNLILIKGGQKTDKVQGYNINILMNLAKKEFSAIEVLGINLKLLNCINISSIREANEITDDIQLVDFFGNPCDYPNNETSKQFVFNANTGKFITSDVFGLGENENTKKY